MKYKLNISALIEVFCALLFPQNKLEMPKLRQEKELFFLRVRGETLTLTLSSKLGAYMWTFTFFDHISAIYQVIFEALIISNRLKNVYKSDLSSSLFSSDMTFCLVVHTTVFI
jgi:hypothetical protein